MKHLNLITYYFIERKKHVIAGLISLMVVDAFQVFIPQIVKFAIDDIAEYKITSDGLIIYSFLIVLSAVCIGVFRFIWRYCLIGTSRRVEEGIRNRLYSHVLLLSESYFFKVKPGDVMAHATNDIANIRMATGMGLVAITDTIILGVAVIFFMCYISVPLTFFALIPAPFLIIITKVFSKKMHAQYREVQAVFSNLTEAAREKFAGIRIIKIYKREKKESSGFGDISGEYLKANMKLVRYTGMLFPMMIFLTNSSIGAVLYFGGSGVISNAITPGDFVAFLSYLALLTWPMMAIGWVINLIQRGRASLERIEKILSEQPEIKDRERALPIKSFHRDITFKNVTFQYDDTRASNALKQIDLVLRKNTITGICGPPGCGKTTLANLLPRLYDVTDGSILFDGVDIRDIKLKDLRGFISFMPQEPFLFSGTIRQNLFIDGDKISAQKINQVLENSALTETVNSFPDGLDTVVGEKGIVLSGGQKQRIALARALLKPCEILILDDPVSQVDMNTAKKIISGLLAASMDKTLIVISHRYKIFEESDHVIVMKNGEIKDQGKHMNLIKTPGYYQDIYTMQMNEDKKNEK